MPKVAIVILNYNGKNFLEKFLPEVLRYSTLAEIYVADNASSDDSLSYLRKHFSSVNLLILDKNHGYAGGYNEALTQIEAEYYVLLNSDVQVTSGWIDPMISFLDDNPEYVACQPKIKDFSRPEYFEYAGACGGFIDPLGYPYCRGRIFDSIEKDKGQYDDPVDVFWASGACMVIRSDFFHKAGGFDASFFAHMEEIDLCWRAQSMGFKTRIIPSATVYHVGGGTLAKQNPQKTYLNFRNGISLLVKNLPSRELAYKLPVRVALDWIAALNFLVSGMPTHAWAIFKAHFVSCIRLRKNLAKRKQTSALPGGKSILFSYFVRRKRKFSDLI